MIRLVVIGGAAGYARSRDGLEWQTERAKRFDPPSLSTARTDLSPMERLGKLIRHHVIHRITFLRANPPSRLSRALSMTLPDERDAATTVRNLVLRRS
jgi:hypothetical protein